MSIARWALLLKQNVANIFLFNFCEQKFVQHGPITIVIDCNGFSLLIFEEKWTNYASGSKSAPNVVGASAFQKKKKNTLDGEPNIIQLLKIDCRDTTVSVSLLRGHYVVDRQVRILHLAENYLCRDYRSVLSG